MLSMCTAAHSKTQSTEYWSEGCSLQPWPQMGSKIAPPIHLERYDAALVQQ